MKQQTGQGRQTGWADPAIRFAFAALCLIKLALALSVTPVVFPDTSAYQSFARGVLEGASWLWQTSWEGLPPSHTMRSPGPGLVMAGFEALFGSEAVGYRAYLLLQTILTIGLLAGVLHTLFLLRPSNNRVLALILVGLALFSPFTLFDLSLLSDAMAACAMTGALLVIVIHTLRGKPLTLGLALGLGVLWGVGLLMRPPTLYFLAIAVPIVLLQPGLTQRLSWATRGLVTLAMLVGPVLVYIGQSEWNRMRTGDAFLTTLPAYNALWPLVNMASTGLVDPFDGEDTLSEAYRTVAGEDRTYMAQTRVFAHLVEVEGWDWRRMTAEGQAHTLQTALAHPGAAAVSVLENLRPFRIADVMFSPYHNFRAFMQLGPWREDIRIPGERQIRRGLSGQSAQEGGSDWPGPVLVVFAVLSFGGSMVSAVVFLVGFVLPPLLVALPKLRRALLGDALTAEQRTHWGLFLAWLFCWMVLGAYGLIHMEDRLALPAIPFGWLTGLISCALLVDWWRRRRGIAVS